MDEALLRWCDEHGVDTEDLSEEAVAAFNEGEDLIVCAICGEVVPEQQTVDCEICGKTVCRQCAEGSVCKDCAE